MKINLNALEWLARKTKHRSGQLFLLEMNCSLEECEHILLGGEIKGSTIIKFYDYCNPSLINQIVIFEGKDLFEHDKELKAMQKRQENLYKFRVYNQVFRYRDIEELGYCPDKEYFEKGNGKCRSE